MMITVDVSVFIAMKGEVYHDIMSELQSFDLFSLNTPNRL